MQAAVLDDLADVAPLPGGVPVAHVYRHKRLLALMEEDLPFREAFLAWGEETLDIYDRARSLLDVDHDDDARAAAVMAWTKGGFANDVYAARRVAIWPLIEKRMTMRSIANYMGVPLAEVVGAALNPRAMPLAERICAYEDHITEHGMTPNAPTLARRFGLSHENQNNAMRVLAVRHGVEWVQGAAYGRRKWPTDLILALRDQGLAWQEVADEVCRQHPELAGEFTHHRAYVVGSRLLQYRRQRGLAPTWSAPAAHEEAVA